MIVLFALLRALYDAPVQQAAQQTADHALDIAWLVFAGTALTVIGGVITAWMTNRRINRSSARSQAAEAKSEQLEQMYINLAADFAAFKRTTEAHGRKQDAVIADLRREVTSWRTWGNRVLAVIKARPDGDGIEGQLPPMPTARKRRSTTMEEDEE